MQTSIESYLLSVDAKESTRATYRKALESFARWVDDCDVPFFELGSNDELIRLRNNAMINLMLRTGLRTIEVVRAYVGDIPQRRERRILKNGGTMMDVQQVLRHATPSYVNTIMEEKRLDGVSEQLLDGSFKMESE